MISTSLKKMSDGKKKNRQHRIKAIHTVIKEGDGNRETLDLFMCEDCPLINL
jgi:hypothetical protein